MGGVDQHASKPIDWNSPRGDLIKRVYWHCATIET
jgi:hypothetical protein